MHRVGGVVVRPSANASPSAQSMHITPPQGEVLVGDTEAIGRASARVCIGPRRELRHRLHDRQPVHAVSLPPLSDSAARASAKRWNFPLSISGVAGAPQNCASLYFSIASTRVARVRRDERSPEMGGDTALITRSTAESDVRCPTRQESQRLSARAWRLLVPTG